MKEQEKIGLLKSEFIIAAAVVLLSAIGMFIRVPTELYTRWAEIVTPIVLTYALSRGGVKGIIAYMTSKNNSNQSISVP